MRCLRLKYVHEFVDRHGKKRCYFRRGGYKTVPLPSPESPEFWESYSAAFDGRSAPRLNIGAERASPGSVSAAINGYYTSSAWKGLRETTTRQSRKYLL